MKDYIKHLTGFSALLDWQARWSRLPDGVRVSPGGLELGSWASRRFLLAAPRRARYGKGLVLGVQGPEALWMSRIRFRRAAMAPHMDPARLYLVSDRVAGDGDALSDIPAFTIGFPVENPEMAALLASFGRLEARAVWVEEGKLQVASGPALFSIPLALHPEGAPVLTDKECHLGRTMDEVISQRLEATNRLEQPSGA